jgi:ABC-type protease/lipase transport system fused ATPase/permease subunit
MSAAAGTAPLRLAGPAVARRRRRAGVVGVVALCLALSVAVQGTVLVAPLLTMHVFDGVLETRNTATLTVLSIAFCVALLLGAVLRHLRAALLTAIAERVGRRIQLQALTAAVRVAVAGQTQGAGLALQDVAELRRVLGGTMIADLLDLLAIPVALGFLWMLHPLFFAVGFTALLLKAALAVAADRATRGVVAEATTESARAAQRLAAALRQPDAVMGLGMVPAAIRRWMPGWFAAQERQDAAQRRVKALQGLLMLADFAQQIAVVTAGAWLLIRHDASPGVLLAATTMVGIATNPIVAIVGRWRDWAYGLLAWRRLHRLVAAGAPPAPAPRDAAQPDGLVFEGVAVKVGEAGRELVRDLSLHLRPGEAWALLGPNGIGKTSLLRAALGLAAPAQGRVLLDGQDTYRADRSLVGRRMGYLPQEAMLLEGSVIENIARFEAGAPTAAVAAARQAGAHDMIGRLHRGYDTPAGPGTGLSGGQQRLVALSRALHGAPRLLVLDEPEAGLDAPAREALRDAVSAATGKGAVVLLVTHDPAPWVGRLDGVLRLRGDGAWQAERVEEGAQP